MLNETNCEIKKNPSTRVFFTAVMLSSISVLPLNVVLPLSQSISDEFSASYSSVYFTISLFVGMAAVSQFLAGPLSDWFGRRLIALIVICIFVISSLGCALSADMSMFTLFRSTQGVIVAGYGVAVATIRDTSGEETIVRNLSYMASAWALVPIVGPTIGGLLGYWIGWRGVFITLSVFGITVAIFTIISLPSLKSRKMSIHEYREGYIQLGRSKRFAFCVLSMSTCLGALYIFLGYVPHLVSGRYGADEITVATFIASAPLGFFFGSVLSGRISTTHSRGFAMMAGRMLVFVGLSTSIALEFFSLGGRISLPIAGFFIGFGNGITLPNATSIAISIKKEFTGAAVGLASALSLGGGAGIAFICGWLISGILNEFIFFCTLSAVVLFSLLVTWLAGKPVKSP